MTGRDKQGNRLIVDVPVPQLLKAHQLQCTICGTADDERKIRNVIINRHDFHQGTIHDACASCIEALMTCGHTFESIEWNFPEGRDSYQQYVPLKPILQQAGV